MSIGSRDPNTGIRDLNIEIRDLKSIDEMRRVEDLQQEVWGFGDREIVPWGVMVAACEVGAILIGAYDGDRLVGFVYGFIGFEDGEVTLHSHMAAVSREYRDQNLGYRLKLAQRERALARGIKRITWTFEPLQSRNAHFNFAKLGVEAADYKINFYGAETAILLDGIGTDRLWVSWAIESERVRRRIGGEQSEPARGTERRLVWKTGDDRPQRDESIDLGEGSDLLIEIPIEIGDLQRRDPGLAVAWREQTRWGFTRAIAAGYIVAEFTRSEERGAGAYLLARRKLTK